MSTPTRKNGSKVKSVKSDSHNNNYCCANCCCSVSRKKKEDFITEINLSLNYNAPKTPIKISTILSTIFRLELVQLFHDGHLLQANQEVGVCLSCATILGNLYQFYSYFVEIRRSDSFVSSQIELLDQLLSQFQQTWTEMNNSTNNSTGIGHDDDGRPIKTSNVTSHQDKTVIEFKATNKLQNIARPSNNKNNKNSSIDSSRRSTLLCDRRGPWIRLTRLTSTEIADAVIKQTTIDEVKSTVGEVRSIVGGDQFADETSNFGDADDHSNDDDDYHVDDDDEDDDEAVGEEWKGKSVTEVKGDGKFSYRNWEFEHVSEKCYRCSTCSLATETISTIKQHIRMKHCTATHPCDKCDRSFLSLKGLQGHVCESRVKKKRNIQFSIDCGEGKFLYRGHWPFHILPGENSSGNENVKKKEFQCGTCNTIRRGRNNIAAHIRIIHVEASECICEFCGKQTANKKAYNSHMQNHSETSLICDICGKQFRLKQSLHEHKMAHEKKYVFKCDVEGCDKALSTRSGLYFHKLTHKSGGVQSHECPHCHKRFMYKHGLKFHISKNCPKNRPPQDQQLDNDDDTHKNRYYCDFEGCDKVLTTKGGLNFHKKTHECGGVQQHECPNCHRRYMHKHGLRMHMIKYCKKSSNEMAESLQKEEWLE